jgi:hypothetical protein
MSEMSVAAMQEAFNRHLMFEFNRDLDGTISTMSAEPFYEVFPMNLRMDGRAPVREWYRRMFEKVIPCIVDIEKVEERSLGFGPSHLAIEQSTVMRLPDGEVAMCNAITVVFFADDVVAGEHLYLDEGYRRVFADALGDDFASFPGVSSIFQPRREPATA